MFIVQTSDLTDTSLHAGLEVRTSTAGAATDDLAEPGVPASVSLETAGGLTPGL